MRDFTQQIDDDGMIDVQKLINLGYQVTVDRRSFKVNIDIPPEFRKKIIYYVMGSPDEDDVAIQQETVKPANLSLSKLFFFYELHFIRLG